MGFPLENVECEACQSQLAKHWLHYKFDDGTPLTNNVEEGEFTESANISLKQTLHEIVKECILEWPLIDAPAIILNWIENGVNIHPNRPIKLFMDKSICNTHEARAY